MTETIQEKVDLGAQVGDRFWLSCRYTAMIDGFEMVCIGGRLSIEGQGHVPHDVCKGTGKVWPLREPCPGCWECHAPGYNEACHSGCLQSNCGNKGWSPITDYDALEAAWLAKGWLLDLDTDIAGNTVLIWARDYISILGRVLAGEGLRGTTAFQTALVRALDKEALHGRD